MLFMCYLHLWWKVCNHINQGEVTVHNQSFIKLMNTVKIVQVYAHTKTFIQTKLSVKATPNSDHFLLNLYQKVLECHKASIKCRILLFYNLIEPTKTARWPRRAKEQMIAIMMPVACWLSVSFQYTLKYKSVSGVW